MGAAFVAAFAERHPAFARAMESHPVHDMDRACAVVVLRQIGLVCTYHARSHLTSAAAAMRTVTGDMLERFLCGDTPQGFTP